MLAIEPTGCPCCDALRPCPEQGDGIGCDDLCDHPAYACDGEDCDPACAFCAASNFGDRDDEGGTL